jgi:FkbM family methyltransferase
MLKGIVIYVKIKILDGGEFKIPGIKSSIYYRRRTIDIHTFREIFLRNEYNIKKFVLKEPEYIIDAGANIGFTSLYFRMIYPKAYILSLEPDRENFKLLQLNTQSVGSISALNCALWSEQKPLALIDHGLGLRGYMVSEVNSNTADTFTVQSTSLVKLIREHNFPRIDILKIDVEGAEKDIFEKNYEDWLPITQCIIIELHDRMVPGCSTAVFKAIINYNFDFYVQGENVVFVNRNAPP